MTRLWLAILTCLSLSACQSAKNVSRQQEAISSPVPFIEMPSEPAEPLTVAFLADIHFHDIYGQVKVRETLNTESVAPNSKKQALVRSMRSQLHSTRLFNENYFVLLAALDDLAKRRVKWVALPGDFSDDGQPINIIGLVDILNYYEASFGMRFFAVPGNHDPVKPFATVSGKSDFLDAKGREFSIFGMESERCEKHDGERIICSDAFNKWGYKEILQEMSGFGFSAHEKDLYYETPFEKANEQLFDPRFRYYSLCHPSSKDSSKPSRCVKMPDASYLVEPVEGLWLLGLDANVYVPKNETVLSEKGDDYKGSSSAGYNALLKHKPFLVTWIKSVVKRAKQHNKRLLAFSHFPMTDFYDNAQDDIERLFGKDKQQMVRQPLLSTAKALADTGLQIHVGGHMHINDTGSVTGTTGNTLFNVQAPTLAAYRPAYKLLTFDERHVKVKTVLLDDVPRYNTLFNHYYKEHAYLKSIGSPHLWDESILNAASYGEFTDKHLQALVKHRYLKNDWPPELRATLVQNTVIELLNKVGRPCTLPKNTYDSYDFLNSSGLEIIFDFYRLRNADSIALVDDKRKSFYQKLFQTFNECKTESIELSEELALLFSIMNKFIVSQPSDNFVIDSDKGEILSKGE